ncbi:sigma 54-interacting transcriptional regulator|uniref:sigma 54-interacting transcriptional regulator n=1 Tax=Dendrosporobacter quercicolus TaxID=146817 RepID=UPI000B880DD5|nr:sigma 54-interacting transcriptional regulator [Dendrosporobacter quercicolus]NSL47818.1 sigma 54-interacting transcriptional regulator [Dendrosporobacter quercicolus DSM 1736]
MSLQKQAVITHANGLHARVAAMIVQKAYELEHKRQVRLFFRQPGGAAVPAVALMPLVALRVKQGDVLLVEAEGLAAEQAVSEMAAFVESDFPLADAGILSQVDTLLQGNAVTAGQIFVSMANGLIVTDVHDNITVFNPAAERIMGFAASAAIGRKAQEIIPGSRLHVVAQSRQAELGCRQRIGSLSIITNRTPLIADDVVYGAMAIFEDISALEAVIGELRAVKELKERLQLVLESVQDGICVANPDGCITYVNPAYVDLTGQSREQLIGQNVRALSPDGARSRVLSSGQAVLGAIAAKPDGATLIANVSPIIVDGEITGAVSVVKNVSEVPKLMHRLNQMAAKAEYLEQELRRTQKPGPAFRNFIGRSGKAREALAIAAKAADSGATVLIRGESGTGKELVAEGIHYAGKRSAGPFIRVNCAAIPENLLESELFGHEKGAFTGAIRQKPGKFSLADGGTIFLDEIGELSKSMQAKLLRVLQQREFSRVGGEAVIKVNVRIIAATSRNLEKMTRAEEFREDLYYRLNVIPIMLPPLRERLSDIPLLADYFLAKIGSQEGRPSQSLNGEALRGLMAYSWPGNVRELENVLERMVTLSEGGVLTAEDLPVHIRTAAEVSLRHSPAPDSGLQPPFTVETGELQSWSEYEKQIITLALRKYGSYNAAGKALGLTHKTVAAKAQKYGIEKVISWKKSSALGKSINTKSN